MMSIYKRAGVWSLLAIWIGLSSCDGSDSGGKEYLLDIIINNKELVVNPAESF